jgi:hypothetical protein
MKIKYDNKIGSFKKGQIMLDVIENKYKKVVFDAGKMMGVCKLNIFDYIKIALYKINWKLIYKILYNAAIIFFIILASLIVLTLLTVLIICIIHLPLTLNMLIIESIFLLLLSGSIFIIVWEYKKNKVDK